MPAAIRRPSTATVVAGGSLALLAATLWALIPAPLEGPGADAAGSRQEPLALFCAAGIRPPVAELVADYGARYGVAVELTYGGSGTLLSGIDVSGRGDLYIAGDDSFLELARERGLASEVLTLAVMRPVIGVAAGNPHGLRSLEDLTRPGLRVGLANPEAAAIGKVGRGALRDAGLWDALAARLKVEKPTVGELANDLALGTLDAALIWDATAAQSDAVEAVRDPRLDALPREVTLGVLTASQRPTASLRLARFLSSRDVGAPVFARHGYGIPQGPGRGDLWAEAPVVDLMCGAMLNAAVDHTIQTFAAREGIEVRRTYNGCGILVAQMKAGAWPDAYFSCDVSFLDQVRADFRPDTVVSRNPLVILVARGNPRAVTGLADLARPGLRVGLADPEKSALGSLTRRLLQREGLERGLLASGNLKVETPTGDLLVNQLRTGSLDAVVVYRSNAARALADCEPLCLELEGAEAAQPWAIHRDSDHPRLLERLREALTDAGSRARFEELGFRWELGTGE